MGNWQNNFNTIPSRILLTYLLKMPNFDISHVFLQLLVLSNWKYIGNFLK